MLEGVMKLQCATIQTDRHTFAVVIAPPDVVGDARRAIQAVAYFENRCFQIPTVLVACTDERVPKAFFGRGDLAVLLAPIPPHTIRWQEMLVGE